MKLEQASSVARWAGGLLMFALGARFAFVSIETAWNRPSPPVTTTTPVPDVGSTKAPKLSLPDLHAIPGFTIPQGIDLTKPEGEPKKEPPPPAKEQRLRVALVVTHGPPRSEVIVGGVIVGQSPYVGDVTCKPGETLKIDILPKRGMPSRFERTCGGDVLRVE